MRSVFHQRAVGPGTRQRGAISPGYAFLTRRRFARLELAPAQSSSVLIPCRSICGYLQWYGYPSNYNNTFDDPALRFLLGYHYGYLGYTKQAVQELDKALDLEPRALGSQKLRDLFARQAGLPARPPADIQPRLPGAFPTPPGTAPPTFPAQPPNGTAPPVLPADPSVPGSPT